MSELKPIGKTEFKEHNPQYELPVSLEKIQAGFPAPNGGHIDGSLDLNEFCIPHPNSCYIFQVSGESMINAGILSGDYLVLDRSKEARNGDIVIASVYGEYTVKYLQLFPKPQLIPANPNYKPIDIIPEMDCEIEGVVITSIRKY